MDKAVKPHHFLPKDFSDNSNANAERYLREGVVLGEMMVIKHQVDVNNQAKIDESHADM